MGFPDSPKLLSPEKDLHATECNFLSRPSKELFQEVCQIAPSNERVVAKSDQERAQETHNDRKTKEEGAGSGVLLASLKVKLPEVRNEAMAVEEEEDGLTTPTSLDHKIPAQICPPAPRKPKPVPSTSSTNRKGRRKRVFLDLSNEIESLFPAAILADFGNKIKKVRK